MVRKPYTKVAKHDATRIGICAGCYTILTPMHVAYLEEARRTCDYLIVLTNFDDYILRKKGSVPVPVEDRLAVLRALRVVDEAFAFEGEDEAEWIRRFKNSRMDEFAPGAKVILYHDESAMLTENGGVRKPEDIVGFGIADGLRMVPRKTGTSVSDIFRRIREAQDA